ncbi:non-specific serine/threonine protein kinase [Ranunculus cassubicifolius]
MTSESQRRVVVIQDASKDVSSSAIGWALKGFPLRPGDKLTLLAILHQVNNPSTLSFKGAGKLLGYKSRVDAGSIFGANNKAVEEEVAKKKDEYYNNVELMKISEQYAKNQVDFTIAVIAGSPPKIIAVKTSKSLKATWVILDRQMKKEKKYFLEKLSCGISKMKRDNNVEHLRGPKDTTIHKSPSFSNNREMSRPSNVTYDEMVPGTPDDDDLFSVELSPLNSSNPSKKAIDNEQGIETVEVPKPPSRERVMSKIVSSSSLNEEKCSPKHLREGEENNSSTPIVEEWNLGSRNEDVTTPGRVGWHSDDAFEKSVCSVCKNRRPRIGWQRDFSYAELYAATDGFSAETFLSEGGFGTVYKGRLRDGLIIAVKQHKDASEQGEKEFKSEVHVLSKARHRNVVMLLGSCSEGNHRLLVYEYVCNGSLDRHISKSSRKILSWDDRVKIALGAARGLKYLHENNIIHRDMRPNNILVTHDHEALLGDFGLAKTQHEDTDEHSIDNRVVGTFGYLAPEYAESGRVSTKTDVYSYGVVLLQLITGLRTTDKKLGEKSLVGWAWPLLKEKKYPDLVDSRILDTHDFYQLFWMVRLAEKCLDRNPDKRTSMEKVVSKLTEITTGDAVGSIDNFSPAQSDTVSSITESTGSQGDEGIAMESIFIDLHSTSSPSKRSGIVSSDYSEMATKSLKSTSSSRSFSSKKSQKKEGVKPRKRSVLYGEMLS